MVEKQSDLPPLKWAEKAPLQVTPADTWNAVVESMSDPTKPYLETPDEDDFYRFYATQKDHITNDEYFEIKGGVEAARKLQPAPVATNDTLQYHLTQFLAMKDKGSQKGRYNT